MTNAPPPGKKFPCAKCGARLDFDPAVRSLKCPYCGHVEKIDPEKSNDVVELDFDAYIRKHSGESTVAGRANQVKCNTCGAVVLLEDKVAADKCPYCASFIENKPESAAAMIPPECMLPFRVENRQAGEAFRQWLESLWFAPSSLKEFANLGKLNGIYVPFWTFDSMTYTFYRGERGDDYQEEEYYTDTETYVENGETKTRSVTKSRTVTKTRWTSVSGEIQHFFDDVPVCASESIPENYAASLTPKELKGVEGFRAEYLSGFTTERYSIGPKEGFDKAKQVMDGEIRQLCMRHIGGDHQRLHAVSTQHVGVTFKHLLLPIWLASYRYQDQVYRVMVNGQTGRVLGDRPYSWVKIVMLVLAILAAILAIFLLVSLFAAVKGKRMQAPMPVHVAAASEVGKQKMDFGAEVEIIGLESLCQLPKLSLSKWSPACAGFTVWSPWESGWSALARVPRTGRQASPRP
jgi:DNA-directed RNA polymerase subunit RPC12/RpoP